MTVLDKYVDEFLATVENEISIDNSIYKIRNTHPKEYFYFPRPAKWLNNQSKKFYVPFFLINKLWNYGLSHLFFIYEFIKFKFLLSSVNSTKLPFFENKILGLGFSERAFHVIPKSGANPIDFWITFPWVNEVINVSASCVSVMSLLNKQDLLDALRLSFVAARKNSRVSKLWSVHTYTAYKWFIVRIALNKLKKVNEVYTAEHFDRWATLAGFWSQDSKNILGIVQHGIVQERNGIFPYQIPNRVLNVSKLFVYDTSSEKIFKDHIVHLSSDFVVLYFKPVIEVTKILKNPNEILVLFVGNTLCENFHAELYKKLKVLNPVKAYYKPHPTVPPSKFIKDLDWQVINQKDFFPDVDLLISYPSTLVEEYESVGTPAFLHSLNADREDIDTMLLKVRNIISKSY